MVKGRTDIGLAGLLHLGNGLEHTCESRGTWTRWRLCLSQEVRDNKQKQKCFLINS